MYKYSSLNLVSHKLIDSGPSAVVRHPMYSGFALMIFSIVLAIDFIAVNGSHPLDIQYWIEFKKNYPKITIIGANIDVSREMFMGSPIDVENKIKENILSLASGGRYICCPVCSLQWGVSIPNILAIPKAIDKYGYYPIQLD
ncbi:MAG: hypothetical protein ACFFKA_13930 [Candidatus Thorarchaeota archaeon]